MEIIGIRNGTVTDTLTRVDIQESAKLLKNLEIYEGYKNEENFLKNTIQKIIWKTVQIKFETFKKR